MTPEDDNNNPPPNDGNNPPPVIDDGGGSGSDQGQSFSFDEGGMDDPEEAQLNRRGSSLSGSSGKAIAFGSALVLGTGIILYYLFSDSPPPPTADAGAIVPTKPSGELPVQPAVSAPNSAIIGTPVPPTAPPAPPPPPPPPPPPAPPSAVRVPNALPPKPQAPLAPPEIKAIAAPENKAGIDKRAANRLRSNMLLLNGGNTTNPEAKAAAKQALNDNDPNAAFASAAIDAASETETAVAGKLKNLDRLIAQGKIVNAVLETALNTDLPGTLRAIISRDIYAEAGRNILIPKGSRLIGTYNTGIFRGQKRVLIVWTRVITPEGTDIMIGSPGVDSLGRAGVEGMVDNKFMESFSAAILTSVISVGVAVAADGNLNGSSTTTTNTDGSTTSSGGAGAAAANSAVQAIGGVSREVISTLIDLRPTITIDQGTRVNVFVNKDLTMPGKDASGSLFVE